MRSIFRVFRESKRLCWTTGSIQGVSALELDPSGSFSSKRTLECSLDLRKKHSNRGELPSILVRPSSNCYLLDIHHIKLLCRPDKCYILDPDNLAVRSFTKRLVQKIKQDSDSTSKNNNKESSIAYIFLGSSRFVAFEHIVLETALSEVMLKFNRRLEIIKPILDILLNETSTNPDASMLRRLLAFRKSLSVFQTNVEQVRYAVSSLLKVDEDMDALYLSRKVESGHHEEVELLLEAYDADLRELESQILSMKTMIEETKRLYQHSFKYSSEQNHANVPFYGNWDSVRRNGCSLSGGTGILMLTIFSTFAMKYRSLQIDTSGARSYQTLTNLFAFVDDLETSMRLSDHTKFNKDEFGKLLYKVVGPGVEEKEVQLIFKLFDQDKSGFIEFDEIVKK
ncbi:MRS2 [Lepeophtheirus salmonis]|uniref:Magnesium transporter MRS2 homolog, mitochondrial n=1 Tax=Lepeophtheirus salmonis TaxID=72036 RepID=A0A7R8CDS5_LEPSM|nr:MRS2 [Lepeophtheirus salmonis]CAF2783714.1 MRS2 [Lepeophtheirus salmonis]